MKKFLLIFAFLTVQAFGTCIPPKGGHCVDLSWTASPTSGVTYNVYRSTTQGQACSAPANKIASGITLLTFADMNVTNGATYNWAISAQNAGGESACTLEVQAQIPIPPQPPSAPSATVQ